MHKINKMACNNCGKDEKCYDEIVYGHCVKIPNNIPYLNLDEYHSLLDFEDEVETKLKQLENYQVNASAIQITVNTPCIDTSDNCVDVVQFSYTLTETAGGVLFSQDFSNVINNNDATTWAGQIKVINNTGVLAVFNLAGAYVPFVYALNNLQLPATIINDLYLSVSGQLIYISNTIHIDNCISGTFNTVFNCTTSNTMFSGSLLTLIELMNKQICMLTNKVQQLELQIE